MLYIVRADKTNGLEIKVQQKQWDTVVTLNDGVFKVHDDKSISEIAKGMLTEDQMKRARAVVEVLVEDQGPLAICGAVEAVEAASPSRCLYYDLRNLVTNKSFLLGVLTPFAVFGVMVAVTLYANWFWRIVL